jgi:hypothetical protein
VPTPFTFATSERAADERGASAAAPAPDSRPVAHRAMLERLLEEDADAGGVNETLGGAHIDITRAY